jgi:hypothetical protein
MQAGVLAVSIVASFASGSHDASGACDHTADVVVWGGTVCGLTASLAAASQKTSVVWLANGTRLGGASASQHTHRILQATMHITVPSTRISFHACALWHACSEWRDLQWRHTQRGGERITLHHPAKLHTH